MNKPVSTSERDIASELRLRPDPLPVTRISRKVLIALGAVGSACIVAAVAWAMSGHGQGQRKPELFATDSKSQPEGLAALPKDYAAEAAAAPKLGPPLPGDLGRPLLQAQGVDTTTSPSQPPAAMPSQAQQQIAQERESARVGRLFASEVNNTGSGVAEAAPAADPASLLQEGEGPIGDRKLAFLNGPADTRVVSAERLRPPVSPYIVQAGSVIPAALITGIRSDLPGQVVAQVSENIYDSPTGTFLLIPQGSKLIGSYDSQIAFGQRRVLLAWTRLILPGGKSIVLERQPAADPQGYGGLQDGVDNHWGQIFSAALVSTLLGVGADIGAHQSESDLVQALRFGFAGSVNQAGQQVVGRSLQVQPTLTIRPGAPVRVMVTRDLVLEPISN